MTLNEYIQTHTERGECKCGKCCDVGQKPDPSGHTADMIFFKVAIVGNPTVEEFAKLTKGHHGEFCECNPLDGKEHNYLELGGWIGDQGRALQYMALGVLLGKFKLLTPRTMFGGLIDEKMVQQMAGAGMVAVQAPA